MTRTPARRGKSGDGALRHRREHGRIERLVVGVLLRIADHHRAVVGLPQRLDRQRQERLHAFQHDDLSLVRAHRRGEPDIAARGARSSSPAARTTRRAATTPARVRSRKRSPIGSIASTAAPGRYRQRARSSATCSARSKAQRVAVAVQRATGAARHGAAQARKALARAPRDRATSTSWRAKPGCASSASKMRAAARRAPARSGKGARRRAGAARRRCRSRSRRSAASRGHSRAERCVHAPYSGSPSPLPCTQIKPEVAARRAMRAVAFVEHDERVAERAHAVGDRGARPGRRRRSRCRTRLHSRHWTALRAARSGHPRLELPGALMSAFPRSAGSPRSARRSPGSYDRRRPGRTATRRRRTRPLRDSRAPRRPSRPAAGTARGA